MNKRMIAYFYLLSFFVGIFLLFYPFAKEVYNKKCIIEKYGFGFNERRTALGLYPIPSDWSIEQLDSCIIWKNPVGKLGHRWKNIAFRECDILNELDLFSFGYDSIAGKYSKIIEVETLYDESAQLKNVIYNLQIGDESIIISKTEADSLLRTLK